MNIEVLGELEEAIKPYRKAGYEILSQTDSSITLIGTRRFSYLGFFIGLLLFWPAALLYLIYFNNRRAPSVCLRVTSGGVIEASGYTLSAAARERRSARWGWTACACAFLLLAAVVFVMLTVHSPG